MQSFAPTPSLSAFGRARRLLLLAALGFAHLALIAALLVAPTVPVPASSAAIQTIAIAEPPRANPAPPPPVELPISADLTPPTIDIAPEPAQTAPQIAAEGCATTAAVNAALAANADVQRALGRMPRPARSVADAVQLWDRRWRDAAAVGGDAVLDPIRRAVDASIREAPPACRDAPIAGPRLLLVAGTQDNVALVFGSGVWRWSDLLDR